MKTTSLFLRLVGRGLAVMFCLAVAPLGRGEILTFQAQSSNYSWFSAGNWFTNDPANHNALGHANTIPGPGDTAIIFDNQTVNATATQINLTSLILKNSAQVNYGDFYVATVGMNPGSGFSGSIINVNTEMDVSGGCGLGGTTLTVAAGATLFIYVGANLSCSASAIFNVGEINLANRSSLGSGTNLVNQGIIHATTNSIVSGSGTFDNQGKVQCDSGTLQVGPFGTWTSATGSGRFKTTATNAVITFSGGLTIPTNVTFVFSGPGLILWPSGATVAGVAQVGIIETNTTLLDAGRLEMDGYMTSNGVIHVVATPLASSVLNCVSGAIGPVLNGPTLNIDFNGQFNILGGLDAQNSVVNNSGTVTWKKADFYLPGSVFNNLAGGLFDCQITNNYTDGNIGAFGYFGGVFNNSGTFRKSLGSHGVVIVGHGPAFNNAGLVDVRSGYIEFAGGTNSGTFNLAAGAEIWFGGYASETNFLRSGVQFIGTNFVRAIQFADLYLAGDVTLANLSLQDSGVIDGPANLTVSNTLALTAGVAQGTGDLTIPAGAILLAQGTTPAIRQRVVNNSGTILVQDGGFTIGAGAVINNLASGVVNCVTNNGIGYDGTPPLGTLNNFGTVLRSGGTAGSYGQIAFWLNFTNYNVVQFLTGSVEPYNYQQVSGSTVIASNVTINGSSSTVQVTLLGGTFTGLGNVACGMSNAAVVIPGSPPGPLAAGSYFQSPAGTLTILIAGTNQYSQLTSSGGPALAGTLNVAFINGFTPAVGQKFYVVLGNYPVAGTFASFSGLHTNGIVLVPTYNYYNVVLTAANDPIITNTTRNGQRATFSYLSTSGYTNAVQYTVSLNPPHWLNLTNIVGDGTIKTITDLNATNATRFYRVAF